MPLYDWECPKCGKEFEESQTLAELDRGESVLCPECDSRASRQMSTIKTRHHSWGSWAIGHTE